MEKQINENLDDIDKFSFDGRLYFHNELHRIRIKIIEAKAMNDYSSWLNMLESEYLQVIGQIKLDEKWYKEKFNQISNLIFRESRLDGTFQKNYINNLKVARGLLIETEVKLNKDIQPLQLSKEKKRTGFKSILRDLGIKENAS
jgi:hypothetical protein